MNYLITKKINKELTFYQKVNIEWNELGEPEDITYYNENNGQWSKSLQQSGWSYQDQNTQEEYEEFIREIINDEFLLERIAFLKENEEGTSGNLTITCLGED